MSWVEEFGDATHVGGLQYRVENGRLAEADADDGVRVGDVWLPWWRVAGWQSACGCGWRGSFWPLSSAGVDLSKRTERSRILGADSTIYLQARIQWDLHLNRDRTLFELRRSAEAVRDCLARRDEAVESARRAGWSWQDIADAVGMTRQAAHRHWSMDPERVNATGRTRTRRSPRVIPRDTTAEEDTARPLPRTPMT